MIFDASDFIFIPPPGLSWARRVLIKPYACCPLSYPVTVSPEILNTIIEGIRKVTDADILIVDGTPSGESIYPIYQALGYNFHRVLMLDVRDSIFLEMENPLVQFFATPTFWVPNVVIRSDFLISVTPFRVCGNTPYLNITNLLDLLPVSKYKKDKQSDWNSLYELGIDKVLADLYFTLPFDLGIIEAREKFFYTDDPAKGRVEKCGKIFIGEPYKIDCEASQFAGLGAEYLKLIDAGRSQLED